eukprot:3613439-Rhodomonas_salina.2
MHALDPRSDARTLVHLLLAHTPAPPPSIRNGMHPGERKRGMERREQKHESGSGDCGGCKAWW